MGHEALKGSTGNPLHRTPSSASASPGQYHQLAFSCPTRQAAKRSPASRLTWPNASKAASGSATFVADALLNAWATREWELGEREPGTKTGTGTGAPVPVSHACPGSTPPVPALSPSGRYMKGAYSSVAVLRRYAVRQGTAVPPQIEIEDAFLEPLRRRQVRQRAVRPSTPEREVADPVKLAARRSDLGMMPVVGESPCCAKIAVAAFGDCRTMPPQERDRLRVKDDDRGLVSKP